jgi:hypothetical protein
MTKWPAGSGGFTKCIQLVRKKEKMYPTSFIDYATLQFAVDVPHTEYRLKQEESAMGENTRLHDGIAGALILAGTLLGFYHNILWLWLPGIVGALMLQSAFSGFCPVYFTLGKLRGSYK